MAASKKFLYCFSQLRPKTMPISIHNASICQPCRTATSLNAQKATIESPADLTLKHEGQWYQVHPEAFKVMRLSDKLPDTYKKQVDTFMECLFLVRRPFLEIIHCMRNMHPDRPINRLVLYGKPGTGKSVILNQVLHCGFADKWTLVHVPSVIKWNHNFQEISMSTWKSGRIDLPLEAADWLQDFKTINAHLTDELSSDLKTTKVYEWSKRDMTQPGTPLMEVIENGINRVRYATDCVGVLLKELKRYACEKKLKLLVTIDEGNSLFHFTAIRREDKSLAPATDVSLNRHFSKLLKNDWNNGVAVLATDQQEIEAYAVATTKKKDKKLGKYLKELAEKTAHASPLPYFLIGNQAFDLLDPFIPIETGKYTEKEMRSCLDYYFEKNWIQTPGADNEEGRKQLAHLSDYNPHLLERICASW